MTEAGRNQVESDPIYATAADWFARLQDSEVTLEETLEWQGWMSADARHAQAFRRLEEAWEMVRSASPQRIESIAIDQPRKKHALIAARPALLWALAASMATAAIALGSLMNAFPWPLPGAGGQASTDLIRTAIGEIRTVTMGDGSVVTLGGDTALEVRFNGDARRIVLAQGEAYFTVAKDLSRPFRVSAGNAAVVAVGTQFNVRRGRDRVVVAVVEGRVRVEAAASLVSIPMTWLRDLTPKLGEFVPAPQPLQLDAGQQTTVGSEDASAIVTLPDPAAVAAWRNGMFSFRSEPLRYVVEDVNRYSVKPIVLEDEQVGDLRITGTVARDNVGEWLQSIERAFGIEVVEQRSRIVLKRREAVSAG